MAWIDCLTAIRTHCTNAGAAVTPPIPVVRLAWPQQVGRQICVTYEGDGGNPYTNDANTLAYRQTGEILEIKVYLLVSSDEQGAAEDTEVMLQNIKEQIVSRLAADMDLGGQCMAMKIGDAKTANERWAVDETSVNGPRFRTLTIPVTVALVDVSAITL